MYSAEKQRSKQDVSIPQGESFPGCSPHDPGHSTPVCSPTAPPDSFQMVSVVDATDENGKVFNILEAQASREAGTGEAVSGARCESGKERQR